LIEILVRVLRFVVFVIPPGEIWVNSPSGIVGVGVRVILWSEIIIECIDLFYIPLGRSSPAAVYGKVIASTTNGTRGD
jgi:hypothetical protein